MQTKLRIQNRIPGIRIKFRSSIVVSPWKWMVGPEAACELLVPFKTNTRIAWSWLVFVSAKKVNTKCSWRISFFHQMPGSVGLHALSHWDPLEGTHTLRWGSGPQMTKEGAGHFGWQSKKPLWVEIPSPQNKRFPLGMSHQQITNRF